MLSELCGVSRFGTAQCVIGRTEELIFALAMPGSRRVQIRGDVSAEIEPS